MCGHPLSLKVLTKGKLFMFPFWSHYLWVISKRKMIWIQTICPNFPTKSMWQLLKLWSTGFVMWCLTHNMACNIDCDEKFGSLSLLFLKTLYLYNILLLSKKKWKMKKRKKEKWNIFTPSRNTARATRKQKPPWLSEAIDEHLYYLSIFSSESFLWEWVVLHVRNDLQNLVANAWLGLTSFNLDFIFMEVMSSLN